MVVNSLTSETPSADFTHDYNFGSVLESKVRVSSVGSGPGRVESSQKKAVDASTLSRRWMIPYERANKTVKLTTQRGIRHVSRGNITRRFPTNDRMLRYPRLPHTVFTDTLLAGEKSSRGNSCSQMFGTSYGFTRAYGMRTKGQAHEALSVFLKNEGVPPVMVMDGSKEQTLGPFSKKLKEACCHQSQIEPHSPWMNACESQIREAKRGSSRKMLARGSPKCLWDYSIELECLIRSSTAHDLYDLDGQIPHSKLFGEPADISAISEFAWYDWVMFYDSPDHTFPESKFELGRWLGPVRDVGSALTFHILKSNGEVIPRSTVRHLYQSEKTDAVMQQRMKDFVVNIDEKLGVAAVESDFPSDALTPVYDY